MSAADRTISRSVRVLRQSKQMSLEDLSATLTAVGYPMSLQVLHKAETGKRRWLAADLAPIAKALRVGIGTLLDDDEVDRTAYRITLAGECALLAAQVEQLCHSVDSMLEPYQ